MLTTKHLLWCILACASQAANGLALPKPKALVNNGLLPRDTDAAEAAGFAHNLPLRIMPLGASITYGYGSSDKNGYRKILRDMLEQNGNKVNMVGDNPAGGMVDDDTEGWKGYTVDQVHAKASKAVPVFKPNIILINAGTNDCIQSVDLARAGDRIEDLLQDLYKDSPRATVILSTLVVNADPETQKRVVDFNTQLKRVGSAFQMAAKRLVVVDMQSDVGPTAKDLIKDGIHPNDAGYKKMAEVFFEGIKEADKRLYLKAAEKVEGLPDDGP
ncbi:carbohydrate esterase family 3 protein [Hypomontagnella submonticulosa]|nr:carbohydrate esterase family 3 protein [Hypomontagnella submonticulosa]